MKYTAAQQQAIGTIDSNLQIIACAGSGKTQVVSARIVEILKEGQGRVSPANIVAFTFTEKAAAELKDRVHRLCRETLGSDRGLAEMYIGTIHGYCLNLLQTPPVYKYLKFNVLTDVQQRLLIDRYSKRSGLTETPLLAGGALKRWVDSRLYQQLIGIINEGNADPRSIPAGVQAAVGAYNEIIDEKRFLDFTMIIARAVAELVDNPALQEKIAGQVRHLIVDEYQDVNPLQEELVRQLHQLGAALCVVGDDDQTIYQWRGSDVGNIIHFAARYPRVKQIPLNENFRSSEGIVEAARQVVERNPERLPKKMMSTGAQPFTRGDLLALRFPDPGEEAAWIARRVLALHGTSYHDRRAASPRGLSWSDFAVLLRSVKNDGDPIIAAFEAAGIPYVVGGMNHLFDTPEVQAVREVFCHLGDHAPPGGSPPDLDDLRATLLGAGLGLTADQVAAGLRYLESIKPRFGAEMDAELYLQRVYLDFLEALGLREEQVDRAAQSGRSGEIVFYNLGKFSQVISDYEQIHFNTHPSELYPHFAKYLHLQAPDYYPEGWLEEHGLLPDAVQVMTVHQAKGMQWPAVFVPCLRKNRFPARRQGGRSVWHVLPESAVPAADRYKGSEEDERRLFYVALTRAERYLACSWAPVGGNSQAQRVSTFFQEFTEYEGVLTKEPRPAAVKKLPPTPRKGDQPLALSFSELKYYFECPYLFKLRFLYGFDSPISRALGYGRSLHNMLDERMLRETLQAVGEAGRNLRENRLGRLETWCGTCERCDHAGLCRARE
ncbi:MAG: ATP-dependent helicase [Candidatus Methylomirabilia bacterium]